MGCLVVSWVYLIVTGGALGTPHGCVMGLSWRCLGGVMRVPLGYGCHGGPWRCHRGALRGVWSIYVVERR